MSHSKYYKQILRVSHDGRKTWEDVEPPQYRMGDKIEDNSLDCGYEPFNEMHRESYSTPYCDGMTLKRDKISQVSYDASDTWEDESVIETEVLIENCEACKKPKLWRIEGKSLNKWKLNPDEFHTSIWYMETRIEEVLPSGTTVACEFIVNEYNNKTVGLYNTTGSHLFSCFSNYYGDTTTTTTKITIPIDFEAAFTEADYMFAHNIYLKEIVNMEKLRFDYHTLSSTSHMFYDCQSLETLDFSFLKDNAIEDASSMFFNCKKLTSIDLSNYPPIKYGFSYIASKMMFFGCSNLEFVDLSGWDIGIVTLEGSAFFEGCYKLKTVNAYNCDEETIDFLRVEIDSLISIAEKQGITMNVQLNY